MSDAEIRGRVERKEWHRLTIGRYLPEELGEMLPEERHALQVMAELSRFSSPRVLASHASAAALHGLPIIDLPLDRVILTRHGLSGARSSRRCVLRAGLVPEVDRTVIDGVPVTSVARTVVDLARSAPRTTAVAAADVALNAKLTTGPEITAAWLRINRAARGHARARRILSIVDGRAESPGESSLRLVLHDHGATMIELQPEIFDLNGRFVGRPDAALLDAGVLLEFDGERKYTRDRRPGESSDQVVTRERSRERGFLRLRWEVERFAWADLYRSDHILERVRQAAAARRGHAPPSGEVRTRPAMPIDLPQP